MRKPNLTQLFDSLFLFILGTYGQCMFSMLYRLIPNTTPEGATLFSSLLILIVLAAWMWRYLIRDE